MPTGDNPIPAALAALLAERPTIAVLSGAGMSAESGVPTFREAQTGLWEQYSPTELATPEAFSENPARVLDWYRWRRELCGRAQPNPAHHAIAQLQSRSAICDCITQNVDGLLQRAGARGVVELHGNLWRQICSRHCGYSETLKPPDTQESPQCPHCAALLRPDVVWFGEALPSQALAYAQRAMTTADLVLVCGTSNLVYPAAGLPLDALRHGKTVVEINPQQTPLSAQVDYHIADTAGRALPALVACIPAG